MAQETVFPLEGSGLRRSAWATSYDSLPSSVALDDGLDPAHTALDRWSFSREMRCVNVEAVPPFCAHAESAASHWGPCSIRKQERLLVLHFMGILVCLPLCAVLGPLLDRTFGKSCPQFSSWLLLCRRHSSISFVVIVIASCMVLV